VQRALAVPIDLHCTTMTAAPIVKWVGGKTSTAQALARVVVSRRPAQRGGRYIEPFLGGASVALAVESRTGVPLLLSDLCSPLIATYQAVRAQPEKVHAELTGLYDEVGTDAEAYAEVRGYAPATFTMIAARFLYLNALCFNGLYRENSDGDFNVPFGKRVNPSPRKLEELVAWADAMKTAEIFLSGFRKAVAAAASGDFVFADPPYHGTFSNYLADGFTDADHVDLSTSLQQAYERGADVIVTNADTPFIRDIYRWAEIRMSDERRSVNRDGAGRGLAPCLLIASSEDLFPDAQVIS